MAGNHVFAVSIRLRDPAKDLGALLADWGFTAKQSMVAGQPRSAPDGRALSGTWPDSYATARLELPEDRALTSCIDHMLRALDPAAAHISEFVDGGGYAELFIGWCIDGSSGDVLPPELMRKLSDRRLALSLDIYPDTKEDDQGADESSSRRRPGSQPEKDTDILHETPAFAGVTFRET